VNPLDESIVRTQPFLHGIAPANAARLAGLGHAVRLPARHRLFEEGHTADRFWLIEAGQVALDAVVPGKGRMVIELLGRGDVVGLSWMLPPFRWGFGAITPQPLQAGAFDAKAVRAEIAGDPGFGQEMTERFLRVALKRLQATRSRLLDTSAHPGLLS
jgi:CRP/FNR family transcriptional regulator, cyclic AMP receptor protein